MSVLHKFKSIFKKDAGPPPSPLASSASGGGTSAGPHIWPMSDATKAQLARGVKYNLRVVLRGMRRTGKTALMSRLTQRPVDATKYVPTPELAAATIYLPPGGGADTTEGAKIEIWDIVDEAVAPPSQATAKAGAAAPRADATTVDVYRGCSAVVFLVDATRRETFEYVKALLPDVPPTVAVLVVLNFSDRDEAARCVTDRDVDDLCRTAPGAATRLVLDAARGQPAPPKEFVAAVSWMPCSMATGLGVDAVRAFLDVPFALAQIEALEGAMRGLYRGIDAVRADMLQRRAEARFAMRQGSSVGGSSEGSPTNAAAAAAAAASPQAPSPTASGKKQPAAAAPAAKGRSPSPPQPTPAAPAKSAPAKSAPIAAPAAAEPAKATKKPSSGGSGVVNDSFFDDVDDDEEPPEEPTPPTSSDDDEEPPVQVVAAAVRPGASSASPAGSASPSAGRSPTGASPPAAASSEQRSEEERSGSPASGPVASPAPRPPAAKERVERVPEAVPSSLPQPATPPASAPAPEAPPQQISNDVNVVDTSTLEPARVDDGFFGGGDDDDDAEAGNDDAADEEAADVPAGAAKPGAAVEEPEGAVEEVAVPVTKRGVARPPAPAPAAAAVSVDVSALLAQMQSALEAAPVADADGDEEAGDEARAKKEKREKKAKKDKGADDGGSKKEKKDKKDKKSKKAAAAEADDDADGGFTVAPFEEDDDLQVMEA